MTRQLSGMPTGTLDRLMAATEPPRLLTRSTPTLERPGAALGLGDQLQTRALQALQMRAGDGEAGTFEGYACVWDVEDSYGTTFQRGCFSRGGLDPEPYALLWMHNPLEVLGTFTAQEDDHGLRIAGAWDETAAGKDARVRAKSGSAPGLSVGFVPIMVDPDDETLFTQCRLVETSQITRRMASVPGASLDKVRVQGQPAELRLAADRALALIDLATPLR